VSGTNQSIVVNNNINSEGIGGASDLLASSLIVNGNSLSIYAYIVALVLISASKSLSDAT